MPFKNNPQIIKNLKKETNYLLISLKNFLIKRKWLILIKFFNKFKILFLFPLILQWIK